MFTLADRINEANTLLAPYAVPHEGRLGRLYPESTDETRFPFQRDRDRIIHSYAFLRLQAKTQVFAAGEMGDHVRTRLTHTLVVAQISRDLARMMRLNEDLSECIALAHDLGHPPFGHAGEEAIDAWMKEHGQRFEHNEQSYRIVTLLEKHSSAYPGLNLNREVTDGLLKHSSHLPGDGDAITHTLEAKLVNIADAVAYNAHDCDDGLTAGLFRKDDLLKVPLAREAYELTQERGTYIRGALQHLMVHDLLEHSSLNPSDEHPISFSTQMQEGLQQLRRFLWDNMYLHPQIQVQTEEGKKIVDALCRYFFEHDSDKIAHLQERTGSNRIEAVKDYVAGMSDTFARGTLELLSRS
ncbi:MAG TPA: dNTP triphosphohydrolase [Candidatus Peribacteraceae bacterium]|nr:dNTP triphosphohydrolase [Candidatus Peribacteraceae bacterium]